MDRLPKSISYFLRHPLTPLIFLLTLVVIFYYKFFIFGRIPFPGDLLIGSYFPWLDYYKMPVTNPLISDVFSQFFLWKYLAISSLKSFQWPLWNPYSFIGTPLLATYHSAVLYPLNILLFFPKYFGWGLFIFSQSLISVISMYLFLGLFTKHAVSKIIGSIIFAFGGLMTTWLEIGTAGHAVAWLPLCLFFMEKYWDRFKIRYLLFFTLSLSLITLAGNPQITTYSFIILASYSIIISLNQNFKIFISRLLPILGCLVVSILLTTIQLLPSLDLLDKSIRLAESYTTEFNFGLLPAKDILKFFISDFFGNPVTSNYWGNLNYLETSGFTGTVTLSLLLYAYFFLNKKSGITMFFLILFSFSLLLIFDNPISNLIYQSKVSFLTSSYASRLLFVTIFSVSVIASLVVNEIIEKDNIQKLGKTILWSWASIIGIIIGAFIARQNIQSIFDNEKSKRVLEFYLTNHDYLPSNLNISIRNSILPLLLISFLLVLFIIVKSYKGKIKINKSLWICVFLFLFLTIDLSRYFLKFNPFVSQSFIFPPTPTLEFLQKQTGLFRVGREHAEVLPPNTWIAYNLQSYEGYDPIFLNQYSSFMRFLNGGDIRVGNSTRYAEIYQSYSSAYLDSMNAKFFIAVLRDNNGYTPGDLLNFKVKETNYKVVLKDKSTAVLENPSALERVHFAPSFVFTSKSSIEDMIMTDPKFDPRTKVAISKDLDLKSISGKGEAKIVYYSPNLVKIQTQTTQDELLVLADQFEEGWKAKIDENPVKISPANVILRAVKVPTGKHEVIFYYWPQSFDLGLKISIITSIFILLGVVTAIRKKSF